MSWVEGMISKLFLESKDWSERLLYWFSMLISLTSGNPYLTPPGHSSHPINNSISRRPLSPSPTSGGPPLHFLALLPILPARRGELVFCLSVNKPRPRDSLLDGANELLLLPSYAGSTTAAWTTGLPDNGSGKGEGVFCGAASSESTQGLVLSLSSNPPQRYASGDGGAIAEGGSQVGGLWGPFTGYATVLKCSKFLKPAQQLLDEFCILGDWFDVI
ncbi:hypothetical protein HPP92_025801 [Vanilla planifolia]|uniref:Uncharacterized protein n=1 Tax=Vanilla planifolia TaxID=51239 RepID=A0A835PK96_VANPL|nr:hypothetical protein HPP92_025801 [Vanilla planifolia]